MCFKTSMKVLSLVLIGGLMSGCANTAKKPNNRRVEVVEAISHGAGEETGFSEKSMDASMDSALDQGETVETNLSEEEKGSHDAYFFAFDSFEVAAQDLDSINEKADDLIGNPAKKITIYGHTDKLGSAEYNIGLGERRAQAVASILRAKGVPNAQIKIVSFGAQKPAVLGETEAAHSKNRRAIIAE